MKVRNMTSLKGNKIANQFDIQHNDVYCFQSYDSLIAVIKKGKLSLYSEWDYSNTTRKYLYLWLRLHGYGKYENKKDIKLAIKNGEIELIENGENYEMD